mmetsp:Transcript_43312/g.111518  ORF Transcript_43312/g.111518 Transcript_43312/m.111518 type:complete len:256 (+) Transcript_43312:68-835(+)
MPKPDMSRLCIWALCLLLAGLPLGASGMDGQSNKPSEEEAERVYNDLNCERTRGTEEGVDWDEVRLELFSTPFPQSMATIGPVVQRLQRVPEVAALTQGASFCGKGQWGMEVHIHEWLLASSHLVHDPEEADFFLVPAYSICMFEGGFFPLAQLDVMYTDMVRGLPYFKRNHGRDHIFTFGSGMSANVFRSWQEEIPEAIFLTPETWLFNDFPDRTEPCFNTWKDIAIPGYLHRHEILSLASQARALASRRSAEL